MDRETDATLPSSLVGATAPPPCRPPLEIIERNGEWRLREYARRAGAGREFSTHRTRMDAMRAGEDRMNEDRHPCLLRWDDEDVVGDIYWNTLFESVHVTYSEFLTAWVVIPGDGHYVFQASEDLSEACEYGKAIQRQYDFKELEVLTVDGGVRDVREHRFLRHSIAASGVRFKRQRLTGTPQPAHDEADSEASVSNDVAAAMPTSTLMAAIPDLSQLEEDDISGPVYAYDATWTDDEHARIALLDPDRVGERAAVKQFTNIVEDWRELADHPCVTTIFEVGPSPAVWVAYRSASGSARALQPRLSLDERLQVLADVGEAVETARQADVTRTAIEPSRVRIDMQAETARASLAGWGIEDAVRSVLEDYQPRVTPFSAPEQLDEGRVLSTTPVYQLGAFAYWLLTGSEPFSDSAYVERAIRDGTLTDASHAEMVPPAVDDVLARALTTDPADRYTQPTTLTRELAAALQP
ncbi:MULTISPECIES: hypothetical protein [Salinibaculum]|uniref:hypothetical protein n=1 Tax=Salinibaculum TaxID=2732368 RepID=UPI0030CC7F07